MPMSKSLKFLRFFLFYSSTESPLFRNIPNASIVSRLSMLLAVFRQAVLNVMADQCAYKPLLIMLNYSIITFFIIHFRFGKKTLNHGLSGVFDK